MKPNRPSPHAASARSVFLLWALALLAWPATRAAAEDFDVRTASIGLADGAWRLSARIDYRLTGKALEALDNGVALTIRVELTADRVRRWLPNAEVVAVHRDWQLTYEPLTKRYIVAYPDGREATSHGTLFGALNALGRVQSLAVAEPGALPPGETYVVAVRAVLDQQTLPGPLQVLAFWDTGFSLESDWYEWKMTP